MALVSLLFGKNSRTEFQEQKDSKVALTIDATLSSTHTASATITKRELEKGSQVNDHMVVNPEGVQLVGVVSETPLDLFSSLAGSSIGAAASLASQAGLGAGLATGLLGANLLGQVNGARARNAFEFMVQAQKQRKLFDLVTGLKNYKNMMITNVVANRSAKIGQAMEFTATIEQITFVSSDFLDLTEGDIAGAIGASAGSNTDLGKQASKIAGDDTSNTGSILFNVLGGFF